MVGFLTALGSVYLWSLRRHALAGPPAFRLGYDADIAISPDDTTLASFGAGGVPGAARDFTLSVVLTDVATGRTLGDPIAGYNGIGFLPDGNFVGIRGDRYVALLTAPSALPRVACAALHRNFTQAEWDELVDPNQTYVRSCPQYPPGVGAPTRARAASYKRE
jgi:hypothetical protein